MIILPRQALFKKKLAAALKSNFATIDSITRETLLPVINVGLTVDDIFGTDEADEILTALALEDDAPIMFESGTIVSNIFSLL